MTTTFHVLTYMMKMWVYKRLSLHDKHVDVIAYMKKMKMNEQLSFHGNHVSSVNLNDRNMRKQTSIAPWQRRWRDHVYEENVSKRTHIHPWQQGFTFVLIWLKWCKLTFEYSSMTMTLTWSRIWNKCKLTNKYPCMTTRFYLCTYMMKM